MTLVGVLRQSQMATQADAIEHFCQEVAISLFCVCVFNCTCVLFDGDLSVESNCAVHLDNEARGCGGRGLLGWGWGSLL